MLKLIVRYDKGGLTVRLEPIFGPFRIDQGWRNRDLRTAWRFSQSGRYGRFLSTAMGPEVWEHMTLRMPLGAMAGWSRAWESVGVLSSTIQLRG